MNLSKQIFTFFISILLVIMTSNAFAASFSTESLNIDSLIKINGCETAMNDLNVKYDGELEAVFSVSNIDDSTHKVTALLATYTQGGKLYQIKTDSVNILSGETDSIEITHIFNTDNEHRANIMLWDSLSGMRPLMTSVDFSQKDGINIYYYNSDNRLVQIDKANGNSIMFTYDNMGNLLTKSTAEQEE